MLHTPRYDVRTSAFCGPTAMSAVTGLPISEIRDALRSASGREKTANGAAWPVIGVAAKDLIVAMDLLGWRVVEHQDTRRGEGQRSIFRLRDFLDRHGSDGPFIVAVVGHYYAVSEGEICDTFTCLPKDTSRLKRGRQKWVEAWWKFAPT